MDKDTMIVAGMAIGVIVWQLPNIQAKQAGQAASIAQAQQASLIQDKITADSLVLADSAKCAEERYTKGVEVISTLGMDKAVPIQEGVPIVAGAYAKKFNPAKPNPSFYIGRGVTVGDAYGSTAVMKFDPKLGYAVASDLCVTSNREFMSKALQQRPGLQRPGTGQL